MKPYHYEAVDSQGRKKKGMISADTDRAARKELRRMGLIALSVEATQEKEKQSKDIKLGRSSLSFKQKTAITRQLATMIDAGSTVEDALNTVAAQAEKATIKSMLLTLRTHISEGQSLSVAMSKQPKIFDKLYIAMVEAGEKSGDLAVVLNQLADYMEKTQDIRSKIQTALIYPAALAFTACIVIIALMTFVVPKLVAQFADTGQTLPLLTRIIVGSSNFMIDYGLYLLAALVSAFIIAMAALKRETVRLAFDKWLLKLPLFGKFIKRSNSARLARTLASLLSAGSPMIDAIKAAEKTLSNTAVKQDVARLRKQVQEGGSLAKGMTKSGYFVPMVAHMAVAGEKSGRLPEMLTKSAEYLEKDLEAFTEGALSLLEPIIIITMGGIVATIVLSVLMPILQMNQLGVL